MYSITVSTRAWWMHEARSTKERGGETRDAERRGWATGRDDDGDATGCLPPLPSQSLQDPSWA